jgi:hypothetical protein
LILLRPCARSDPWRLSRRLILLHLWRLSRRLILLHLWRLSRLSRLSIQSRRWRPWILSPPWCRSRL